MDIATVNGVEREYEVVGSGEPVLFISPVLADGFLSLLHVEECTIDGVGHLLHGQRPEPVGRAMAEFLESNSMTGD